MSSSSSAVDQGGDVYNVGGPANPPGQPINWTLIAGIAAGVVVLLAVIFMRRGK